MQDHVFPGDLAGGFTAQEPDLPSSPPRFGQGPDANWPQDEPRRTRRLALLLAAAVPWLVLLAILLRPSPDGVRTPPTVPTEPSPAAGDTLVADPTPAAAPPAAAARTYGDVPSKELAGATAVVVARAHLGTVGPAPIVTGIEPGPPGRYVEHVAVEWVDMPSPGAAVVTVVAVLLTASEDQYDGVDVVRLAVPIVFEGGRAAPGGQPWNLPAPDLGIRSVDVAPDQRPELADAVHAALAAAGFSRIEDLRVASGDGWPVVAEFSGVGHGQTQPVPHQLWLRRHLDGFVVAGTSPSQETRP